MDNLQYLENFIEDTTEDNYSFKPYYKWITFNTNYIKELQKKAKKF